MNVQTNRRESHMLGFLIMEMDVTVPLPQIVKVQDPTGSAFD